MKLITLSLLLLFNLQKEIFSFKLKGRENPIKNVIILGLENQSFDHILGFMEYPIGELNETTIKCNEYKGNQFCQKKGSEYTTSPDPKHTFRATNQAILGTMNISPGNTQEQTMSWFAKNQAQQKTGNAQDVMDCFAPEQIPVMSTLAREFKTATRWFSSVPTCTDPNKYFYHCATSQSNTDNCDGWYCSQYPMEARTIYENLEAEGYSTKIYWQDWNEAFAITPLNKDFNKFEYDIQFEKFFKKLEEGTLEDYTFLIPRINWDKFPSGPLNEEILLMAPNTQHPDEDFRSGEKMVKLIYEKLRASQYWEKSLLLITYDEAGGFFDHIVPPTTAVNPSPEFPSWPYEFDFTRYGIRVPGIVISPWIQKGVDTTLYDHSSVPRTVKEIFDLKSDYLSERDKVANSFIKPEEILEEMRQDCPLTLPDIFSIEKVPLHFKNKSEEFDKGTHKNQVALMAKLLMIENKLNKTKYDQIIPLLKTNDDAVTFLQEAFELLGYKKKTNRQFIFLSRNVYENIF